VEWVRELNSGSGELEVVVSSATAAATFAAMIQMTNEMMGTIGSKKERIQKKIKS
jgi:hypothetical protein